MASADDYAGPGVPTFGPLIERCPKCGSDNRAVQLSMARSPSFILGSCRDAWHRCLTCGSPDPKVLNGMARAATKDEIARGHEWGGLMYDPCSDPFHSASTEPGDET